MLEDTSQESLDTLLYRMAEKKSIKIGKICRILKSISVDCLLNQEQQAFAKMTETLPIQLSNGQTISYEVKDKPFSSLCDFTDSCEYACANTITSSDQVDLETYSYRDTFQPKLEDKIKQLFSKKHVYRKDELWNLLKGSDSLSRTLSDMIEYKTPISDKYSKLGYLVRVADLYLFQPVELKDPRTFLYDRQRPIPVKPKSFMIVQEKKEEESKLLRELDQLYQQAKHTDQPEEDWYQLYSKAGEYMKEHTELTDEDLDKYLIIHLCEQLPLEKEVELLNTLATLEQPSEFESKLQRYYESCQVEVEDIVSIGLLRREGSKGMLELYVKGATKGIWRKATPSEKELLSQVYEIKKEPIHSTLGFMGYYTDHTYQFKVKDKKNPDTRGSYLLIKKKSDIIDFMNGILKKEVFTKENTKRDDITRTELTILAELYMRHLNDTKKERYFLSKVEYHLMIEKG